MSEAKRLQASEAEEAPSERSEEAPVKPRERRGAVAVGVFDGVHLGHQLLLQRTHERAGGGRGVAVSFEPHPDIVLAREFRPLAPLTPLPQKHARLAALGV